MLINYVFALAITGVSKHHGRRISIRKSILIAGVTGNLLPLVYYKYAHFLIEGINHMVDAHYLVPSQGLPLGISFFTFTQIAYLVDAYRRHDIAHNPLDYSLFVSFFPRITAGPIVRYSEIMPEIAAIGKRRLNYSHLSEGLLLLSIGLFKKVVLAAPVAEWADNGFNSAQMLGFVEAWMTSLSYSLQLYLDFSGYTDMALGIALMFNVDLPINFNAPYRATSIQDFWGRWHITLSRFLRDYVYIPLGGNRFGEFRTFRNLLLTFLICGLWHGTGGLFVFWGLLHGTALIIYRLWKKVNFRMNAFMAWVVTFGFVNMSWVFFRATSWENALDVLKGMVGQHGVKLPASWTTSLALLGNRVIFTDSWLDATKGSNESILVVLGLLLIAIFGQTSHEMVRALRPRMVTALLTGIMLFITFIYLFSIDKQTPFIYFRF
jgi:alginate O-acetyltransferase complex protein AlgI